MQCDSYCNLGPVSPLQTSPSHLRCDVVWGAAEGACAHAFIHVLLTHAKVSNFDVALRVQHHVVELQIPVADTGCEDLWPLWYLCVAVSYPDCCSAPLPPVYLSAAHVIHQETNNNLLAWFYNSMCVCACVSCVNSSFSSSFTTSGRYICHKAV